MALPAACPAKLRGELQTALRTCGAASLPLFYGREITNDILARHDVVAVGDFETNPLLDRLYALRLCFADQDWPGRGGHAVTTLANPFGLGRDVIVLAGSTPAQMAASVREFRRLATRSVPRAGGWHAVRATHRDLQQGFCPSVEAFWRSADAAPDESVKLRSHAAVEQALRTYLTGQGAGIAIFRDYLLRYLDAGDARSGFAGGMVYSWFWKAILVWELVQCQPAFSDADQRRLTRGLFDVMEWLGRAFAHYLDLPPGEIRQNHRTYLALSLHLGRDYFRRRHGWQADANTDAKITALFEGQCRSAKIDDDASGYSWQVPRHLLIWLRHRGRHDYFDAGHLRTLADQAVLITDNLGAPATYGDSHAVSARNEGPQHTMLAAAHWRYRDPVFRWFLDRRRLPVEESGRDLEMQGWFDGRYAVADRRTAPPDRYLGVKALMLDRPPIEWVQRRFPGLVRPRARYFDKIVFRSSFDPADEYLLLEGTSTFTHGHQDGNGIVHLTWNRRRWLHDCDYLRGMPEQTNGLTVVRNGATANTPPLTVLRRMTRHADGGVTHTVLENWNGGDWHRFIVWRKGAHFLVADRFVARKAGEYRLDRRWRCMGQVVLKGSLLACEQKGERFFVRVGDGCALSLQRDGPEARGRECGFDAYPHAGPEIAVLTESCRATLRRGESRWFFAVLSAKPAGSIRVAERNPTFVLGGRRHSSSGLSADSSPRRSPVLRSTRPGALSLRPVLTGCATALACDRAGVVAGFEDGRLAAFDNESKPRWIRRLAGRVTALGLTGTGDGRIVAAGAAGGRIYRLDAGGGPALSSRVGADGTVVAALAPPEGPALLAGTPEGLTALDHRGKMLWMRPLPHGSSGCLVWADAADGVEARIVAGANYHGSLRVLTPDGRFLARPWIRMDSTVQCMTSLEIGDLNGDGAREIIWGTLGHTVLVMRLPGEPIRAQVEQAPGRTLVEGRMAGAVLALRLVGGACDACLVAVDAAGYAARFDGTMTRRAWTSIRPGCCVAAAISGAGAVCLADDAGIISLADAEFRAIGQCRIGASVRAVGFAGAVPVVGTDAGIFLVQ
jgi:hypothetical protein